MLTDEFLESLYGKIHGAEIITQYDYLEQLYGRIVLESEASTPEPASVPVNGKSNEQEEEEDEEEEEEKGGAGGAGGGGRVVAGRIRSNDPKRHPFFKDVSSGDHVFVKHGRAGKPHNRRVWVDPGTATHIHWCDPKRYVCCLFALNHCLPSTTVCPRPLFALN